MGAESCELFWEVEDLPPVGATVQLEVRIGRSAPLYVSGQVHHPHGHIHGMERSGAWVRIDGPAVYPFAAAWAQAAGRPLSWGRRGAERVPVGIQAEVEWAGLGRKDPARILDLSRSGARVWVGSRATHPPSRLTLKVKSGLLCWESVGARVAWSRLGETGREVGLEFVDLSPSARAWLHAALEQGQARRSKP